MNTLCFTPLLAAALALPAQAQTQDPGATRGAAVASAPADMSEGEVRKIDMDAKKITLKHGEIRNLDMPPMTMVFQVRDASLLDKVKPGDRVRFTAEKTAAGGYVVTGIQAAK